MKKGVLQYGPIYRGHRRFIGRVPDLPFLCTRERKGRVKDSAIVTVTKNGILTALNKPEDFIPAIVEVDGETTRTYYIHQPFHREPDFAVTNVNYNLAELRNKGVVPV